LEMGVSWIICPGWPWIMVLPISVSQVARITGMSLKHPAQRIYFFLFFAVLGFKLRAYTSIYSTNPLL
jgi:hypothetical protein